jgi:hypothetical protein
MTTNLSDYVQQLRDALTTIKDLCEGGDAIVSAIEEVVADALAEPVPLALHDAPEGKPKCKFAHDTCDGINGTSGFVCNDCVEDAAWEAEKREAESNRSDEGRPACELIEEDVLARKPALDDWMRELATELAHKPHSWDYVYSAIKRHSALHDAQVLRDAANELD